VGFLKKNNWRGKLALSNCCFFTLTHIKILFYQHRFHKHFRQKHQHTSFNFPSVRFTIPYDFASPSPLLSPLCHRTHTHNHHHNLCTHKKIIFHRHLDSLVTLLVVFFFVSFSGPKGKKRRKKKSSSILRTKTYDNFYGTQKSQSVFKWRGQRHGS
jgi:hypothetical protein